jgi:hypothetical protein
MRAKSKHPSPATVHAGHIAGPLRGTHMQRYGSVKPSPERAFPAQEQEGLPEEALYLQHIDIILREEGIQSAEELRELLELHALPVGHGKPFEGFSERDFGDDCKGVREKVHDLLTLRTMFHSHHVEPWKDREA